MSCFQRLILSFLFACLFLSLGATQAQNEIPPGIVAVVRGQGALLLDDSGRQLKAALPPGELVMLLGRSADEAFLYVSSTTLGTGWVAAGSLLTTHVPELPVRAIGDDPELMGPLSTLTLTQTQPLTQVLLPTPTPQRESSSLVVTSDPALTTPGISGRVTLTDSRLNLRSGPGTNYPIVARAQPGSTWQIIGRTQASDWLQVTDPTAEQSGWASAAFFSILSGTLELAPVITNVAPPPILVPTPTPVLTDPATESSSAAAPALRRGSTGLAGTLVFQDRIGGTIYVYDLDSDTLRPLTHGIDPAISNDGRMVAFARDGGDGGLYVIDLDGTGERRIYNERGYIRSPKWSPDDQYIVFSSSSGYDDCRLLDGGVCLPDAAIWDSLPPELQSGTALNALRGLPNQREYFYSLARIDLNGENYRDIPALNKAQAPDWNEAGITYHSSSAGIQITADTSDVRSMEVANDALLGYFQDPDWQPGGGRIVFQRQMNGQHWQIFAVNPDGTGLVALTRPVTALVDELPSNVSPAWSPDGQHIVYLSNRSSIESAGAWHLWVMNADGTDQRMLPIDVPLDYTFSAEQMVSWGPAR